jgi:diadenosine tetraphosphate (Ap4A) HIT family hydrolase
MPESADEVYARVVAAVGRDGRLPTPSLTGWDTFPWEAVDETVVPKVLPPPGEERVRDGDDGGGPCPACTGALADRVVWEDEYWFVTRDEEPSGLPLVLTLWTREHVDVGDLDDEHAGELGRMCNRLVRIMQSLPNIGRVHVGRWGDGCAHLHVWFVARTKGLANILGSYAVEWDEILPPVPEDVWRADLHAVAGKLANWGGHARA